MPTIAEIKAVVAHQCGVTVIDLESERTGRRVTRPRHLAMYLAHRLTGASLPRIGREFGRRNHTTVLHAVHRAEALVAGDLDFAARVAAITALLDDDEERLRIVARSTVASVAALVQAAVDEAIAAFAADLERDPIAALARLRGEAPS